jgi:hypothetical protein
LCRFDVSRVNSICRWKFTFDSCSRLFINDFVTFFLVSLNWIDMKWSAILSEPSNWFLCDSHSTKAICWERTIKELSQYSIENNANIRNHRSLSYSLLGHWEDQTWWRGMLAQDIVIKLLWMKSRYQSHPWMSLQPAKKVSVW